MLSKVPQLKNMKKLLLKWYTRFKLVKNIYKETLMFNTQAELPRIEKELNIESYGESCNSTFRQREFLHRS